MTELLCVPFKQTLRLDLRKELSDLIESITYQSSSFFEDDLTKIAALRERVCDSEVSEGKLLALKQYYVYLEGLCEKFPDNQIQFTWFQTLSQKSCASAQYSIKFEMLNVLYNIGSIYSLLAMDSNDGSTNALKKLCIYFQKSAGCFQYIVQHLQETKEPVFDQNTGLALTELMLAQAQECFWFKAVRDSHKDSLISRLAQQTADYYEKAFLYSKKSELIRSDWTDHLSSKSMHFKAVAFYRNAISLGQNSEYGAMVKSLRIAKSFAKKSSLQSKDEFIETIQDVLKNAERDNDFIYLQPVPSSVPALKPAPMVKPLPIDDTLKDCDSGQDKLFLALLPLQVVEACTAYNERQDSYINEHIIRPLESLNKILTESLPKNELPPDLKPISMEELHHYDMALKDQESNNNSVKKLLEEIDAVLEKEAETNDYLSARFGSLNWDLPKSSTVNITYTEKLRALRDYLKQGQTIDDETRSLFQSIDSRLVTFEIKIPESNNPIVSEVSNILKKREKYCRKVESESSEHRILPKIISAYRSTGETNFEGVFREHLKYLEADRKFIQEQKLVNKSLLEKLHAQGDQTEIRRLEPFELYTADFRHSMQLLNEVKINLEEGADFYQKLIKSASKLLLEVQDFEASRRDQQRALEAKLCSDK